MESRVILVCVGFLEANVCFINRVHWVYISGFCLYKHSGSEGNIVGSLEDLL